jgi:hypothetical protein
MPSEYITTIQVDARGRMFADVSKTVSFETIRGADENADLRVPKAYLEMA